MREPRVENIPCRGRDLAQQLSYVTRATESYLEPSDPGEQTSDLHFRLPQER
jgi:hypothetical protein